MILPFITSSWSELTTKSLIRIYYSPPRLKDASRALFVSTVVPCDFKSV